MIENPLDIGGAVAFWTPAEFTDRTRLAAGLAPLGLEEYVPGPRPAASLLRDALEDALGGPRVLVRPLADRDGFTVVREERGRAGNAYTTALVARVDGVGVEDPPRLAFEPPDERAALVEAAFARHLGRIPAAQLSLGLVRIVERFGGTRLKPTGAIYWIPGPKLDDWAAVARAVEGAADGRPSAVYLLRHRLDADAVRAIRDAVVADVRGEVERIRAEVVSGELGGRALEGRRRRAVELRHKVLLYEDVLSVALRDLHAAVDGADQAAATAALLLGAESQAASTASR